MSPEEAKILKFDQERSIADTMALKSYDEENAMEGLKAKNTTQWKIACYKAEKNLEKSV
ncbi:9306_t:CDS:2, partial [Funneliformis geosporum]